MSLTESAAQQHLSDEHPDSSGVLGCVGRSTQKQTERMNPLRRIHVRVCCRPPEVKPPQGALSRQLQAVEHENQRLEEEMLLLQTARRGRHRLPGLDTVNR
ncbi:uncharacterized protein V6R79_003562 [Siganus canaliculatus]